MIRRSGESAPWKAARVAPVWASVSTAVSGSSVTDVRLQRDLRGGPSRCSVAAGPAEDEHQRVGPQERHVVVAVHDLPASAVSSPSSPPGLTAQLPHRRLIRCAQAGAA
jgi:hypothetical protein